MSEQGLDIHSSIASKREPSGIGGWLILPIIHLAGDAIVVAMAMYGGLTRGPALAAMNPTKKALTLVYTPFSALICAYAVYCAVRLFQKKRVTPGLMTGFFCLVMLNRLLILLAIYAYANYAAGSQLGRAWPEFISAVAAVIVWGAYFRRSARVKNTFVN